MSEMEMKNDVEAEEFTDEMSDEAIDREEGLKACSLCGPFACPVRRPATDG